MKRIKYLLTVSAILILAACTNCDVLNTISEVYLFPLNRMIWRRLKLLWKQPELYQKSWVIKRIRCRS